MLSFSIRNGMAVLMLCSVCGCSISKLAVRAAPLHLELAATAGAVRIDTCVTLHVRLWNTHAVPVRNVDVALIYTPSFVPVGGTGSTLVRTDYGVMNIDRIMRLDPGGFAEWWLVLRVATSGDASARVVAVLANENASVETVQWQVVDDVGTSVAADSEDPAVLAQTYIARSLEYRASGRRRDELLTLYTARVFTERATAGQLADNPWTDVADRARELYEQEYGAGPAPMRQAALPRTSVLNGVVLDKVSQTPVADATVTLRSTVTDAIYAMVTTGTDGAFQIPELGVEPVVMITSMQGYVTSMHSGFELCPNVITRLITELESEPAALQRNAESWDLAELHGTVTGYHGDAAADVEVILVGADTRAAVTDAHGEFRFTDVAPGDYTFVAQKPGYAAIERGALNVPPGDVLEVQFTLEPE